MSKKAGWYPDPWPGMPGEPPLLRYWNGQGWTEHARTKEEVQQAAYAGAGPAGSYAPPEAHRGGSVPPMTPDGPLRAGWWQRVGAYLIDGLILSVVGGLLAAPWLGDVLDAYGALFEQAMRDAEAGRQTMDTTAFEQQIAGPMTTIALIFLGVGFVYHVGFLMTFQATPGKFVLGLRVRLRSRPGPMPLGTVLLRWAGQFGYSILNLVPTLGLVFGLYGLLDVLWPLWDGKKQALHDKIARTNVVRVR